MPQHDEADDSVHIDVRLTRREYEVLLMLAGYAAGSVDDELKWKFIHIANRLFADQPNFQQYEIPFEYKWESVQ